jgi:hypothetical protein
MSYKLTTEGKKLLTSAGNNHSKLDESDKGLFIFAYNEYKKVSKSDRNEVSKEIKLHIEAKIESTNVQNAVLRVVRSAYKYVDMQVIANFDKLEYANIKSLVVLFTYIEKNVPDKAEEVREAIKVLHQDDMSVHRYNNLVASKIKELKAKHKVVETVEGDMIKVTLNSVLTNVAKLSVEDKAKLLEELQAELTLPELSIAG